MGRGGARAWHCLKCRVRVGSMIASYSAPSIVPMSTSRASGDLGSERGGSQVTADISTPFILVRGRHLERNT